MPCARCDRTVDLDKRGWCAECEREYDGWVRRYASDIILPVVAGMVVVMGMALGIPLLGVSYLAALAGVFAGFGSLVGLFRLNARRRRRQFLRSASLPRAYLPTKT